MKAICREWKFGLTIGKEYAIIPYQDRLKNLKNHVRIENDFGQTFDYAKSRFEITDEDQQPTTNGKQNSNQQ